MSYNIRYGTAEDGKNSWKYRGPLVSELIQWENPDIIGTQEALRFQLDYLCKDLDLYGMIGSGRDDGNSSGEYAAILYRKDLFDIFESGTFWFSETPDIAGSCHWGNRLPRICSWALLRKKEENKLVYLYNVHLDHQSGTSRKKSMYFLKNWIATRTHSAPVVICGDFNVPEWNHIVRILKYDSSAAPGRFVDTFRKCNRYSIKGTFNFFTWYKYGPRIDYIFAQDSIDIKYSSIVNHPSRGPVPSDHYPVSAKLSIL